MAKKKTELEKAQERVAVVERQMHFDTIRHSLVMDRFLACVKTLSQHDPGAAQAYHDSLYSKLDKLNEENK